MFYSVTRPASSTGSCMDVTFTSPISYTDNDTIVSLNEPLFGGFIVFRYGASMTIETKPNATQRPIWLRLRDTLVATTTSTTPITTVSSKTDRHPNSPTPTTPSSTNSGSKTTIIVVSIVLSLLIIGIIGAAYYLGTRSGNKSSAPSSRFTPTPTDNSAVPSDVSLTGNLPSNVANGSNTEASAISMHTTPFGVQTPAAASDVKSTASTLVK